MFKFLKYGFLNMKVLLNLIKKNNFGTGDLEMKDKRIKNYRKNFELNLNT